MDRRGFLKGIGLGALVTTTKVVTVEAKSPEPEVTKEIFNVKTYPSSVRLTIDKNFLRYPIRTKLYDHNDFKPYSYSDLDAGMKVERIYSSNAQYVCDVIVKRGCVVKPPAKVLGISLINAQIGDRISILETGFIRVKFNYPENLKLRMPVTYDYFGGITTFPLQPEIGHIDSLADEDGWATVFIDCLSL